MLASHWFLLGPRCKICAMICGIGSAIVRLFLLVLAAVRGVFFLPDLPILLVPGSPGSFAHFSFPFLI